MPRDIALFLSQVTGWLAEQPAVDAVLLVGSHARGAARASSDVDLVFICQDPHAYLDHAEWLSRFGEITRLQDEDYGPLTSRRVFYTDGLEVEFGITTPHWVSVNPVDPGTRRVVADGARIILDRTGILAALLAAIRPT